MIYLSRLFGIIMLVFYPFILMFYLLKSDETIKEAATGIWWAWYDLFWVGDLWI